MKNKKIYFFILFILICFIFPAILTRQSTNNKQEYENTTKEESTQATKTEQSNNSYTYTNYQTIKLLHAKTNEVEEVNLDEYVTSVVSAEMPATYEIEAIKAQAVVARTYTIYKIGNKKHETADICDDSTCCQAWISKEDRLNKWEESSRQSNWDKISNCVKETAGKIITYNNQPIDAFFHANSGGTTEVPVNVWGGSGYPYLQVVETSGEDAYSQYASQVDFSNDELLEKLKTKYPDIKIDFANQDDIKIIEYTQSKRAKTVKFGNREISGVEARTLLGLKSTNFEISKNDEGKIVFSVKGYGHGVGMSQTGADAMAKSGSTYEDIINHFYVGVEIKELNSI